MEMEDRAGIIEQSENQPSIAQGRTDRFQNVLRIISGMSKQVRRSRAEAGSCGERTQELARPERFELPTPGFVG
jgi:hypothetical protein